MTGAGAPTPAPHPDAAAHAVDWSDRAAVAACIESLRPRLLAFITGRMSPALRQRIDPDDIVQEVHLAAGRPAGDDACAGRTVWGRLAYLAELRVIDAHRRHFRAAKRDGRREVSLDATRPAAEGGSAHLASVLAASITTPSAAVSRAAREAALQRLIEDLSAEQQRVIHLRYVEGLATKEIARQVGKSDGAVRVLISRVLDRLRAAVERPDG